MNKCKRTINHLFEKGIFVETYDNDGNSYYKLNPPFKIHLTKHAIKKLEKTYLPDEELGGYFKIKVEFDENESSKFCIEDVYFVRNAIEDKPRDDGRDRSNAYLSSSKEARQAQYNILIDGCLPFHFHTHPTCFEKTESDFFGLLTGLNKETSPQDQNVSEQLFAFGDLKAHLPNILVTQSSDSKNFFIGVYGGSIAPYSFSELRTENNVEKGIDLAKHCGLSEIKWNDQTKIMAGLIVLLVIFFLIKFPKSTLMVSAILTVGIFNILDDQETSDEDFYCQVNQENLGAINIPTISEHIN